MKTKILYSISLIILSFVFANAQCTELAFNFGHNSSIPSYNISGDVTVTLNTDNTITLNLLQNFSTANGPDVRAYLVKSNGATDNTLINSTISNLVHLEFGLVNGSGGAQSFTVDVPENDTLSEYDTVFFYCFQFSQFWDFGKINAFSSSNCALLSIEETSFNAINLYPNPFKNNLKIATGSSQITKIEIYDVLGKNVFNLEFSNLNNIDLDVSTLKTDVYLIQIIGNNQKSITKRLIKQ